MADADRALPALRWLILMVVWTSLWPGNTAAQLAVQALIVERPRPFGYVIGDEQDHRVVLVLNRPYRLLEDSIPAPGTISQYLTLKRRAWSTHTTAESERLELTLTYQLIGAPPEASDLSIPPFTLAYTDGQQRYSRNVPEWRFRIAPLTPPSDASEPWRQPIRSGHAPRPIDLTWIRIGVLAAGGLLLAVSLGLITGWLRRRANLDRYPFASAYRTLRRLRRESPGTEQIRRGLACLHAAFDKTAGRAVFADDLGPLFQRQGDLTPLREPIAALYAQSRRIHFTEPDRLSAEDPTLQDMLDLCRRCRDLERSW